LSNLHGNISQLPACMLQKAVHLLPKPTESMQCATTALVSLAVY